MIRGKGKWRICAICLEDILREEYGEHMGGHGYEELDTRPREGGVDVEGVEECRCEGEGREVCGGAMACHVVVTEGGSRECCWAEWRWCKSQRHVIAECGHGRQMRHRSW